MNHSPPRRGPAGRSELAAALKAARQQAGLAGAEAGRRAGMGQSKVSKIERRALLPSPEDTRKLCDAYGVSAEERGRLVALAASLKDEASSRLVLTREGTTRIQQRVAELEESASLVRSYQPAMVLGLLQTVRYINYVFGVPAAESLTPEDIAGGIQARKRRQALLDDESRRFVQIMSEGALRWHVGSPSVMVEQIEQLIEIDSTHPNVKLGLIPWTRPVEIFPKHGFHIYDRDAVIVGTEGATAIMTSEADITRYVDLMDHVENVAVYDSEAHAHLARLADEYRNLGE